MQKRNPIVVVLGHVDHGKTTLLDAIRKTSVASREAGGITQSIGASVVNNITFIDTPGHAVFTKMRGKGASVADIAILVVAQDDGVALQTKEAIGLIKESGIKYIVAATKSDVAGVNPEKVKGELEKEGIAFEGRGGDVPFISLSAKTGNGIEDLLATIILLAEVSEIKGDMEAQLEPVLLETIKDKRGTIANVIVRNGSLNVGQEVEIENLSGKIKALFNDKGESVKTIGPGEPAQVLGLVESDVYIPKKVLGEARRLSEDELPIVLKAANQGSLEAIIAALPSKVVVLHSGIGDVTGSDILTAKIERAYVLAFESKVPNEVVKLAESEKVKVERFEIIYELLQRIDEIFKGGKVEILGRAQVLASFPFNDKKIAGSKVIDGRINKGDKLTLLRDEKEIGKAKAISLKKQKLEVGVVGANEEFGVILEPQLDFRVGDMLVSTR